METQKFHVNVQSEIGRLKAVVLHTPGPEVENMTPRTVERALYSDILNLAVAKEEYTQLSQVLDRFTTTFYTKDLLEKVLDRDACRQALIGRICRVERAEDYYDELMDMTSRHLATKLIEGLPARMDNLTAFLNDDYYALLPLYNFYFTRDASAVIGNNALICRMANKVRMRESLIMEAIFRNNPYFEANVIGPTFMQPAVSGPLSDPTKILMEGGDILMAREDILLVGNGMRTSSQGVDFLINRWGASRPEGKSYILVQQLPSSPESFIHLDMVFTMLDKDKCMAFEPLILNNNSYETVQITLDGGKVEKIRRVTNLPSALRRLGMDLEPVLCGGSNDEWDQEREQWHSGSNFFAIAPGKVLSYARNIHTLNEMNKHGFEIVPASDVISGKVDIESLKKCVITIQGAELARGGGGARCMTLPIAREPVDW